MARNELEIILRLRDQMTRALRNAQQALKGLEGELKRARDAARALNRQLEDAAPYSFGLAKAAGVAAGAMGGLGLKALSVAGQFEQMRIAFTTMLGDAEKADRFLRELYDFAAKTPFEIEGLQKQVQLMLALGFRAEEVIPTLRAVGDAVAALGGSSALLDRVVLALGQIRAKGKVSAEEMRQLAEAGIPAWEMLAKKIGVDIPTAMKLAEKGAIDAATGVSAILEGMQARFSGMMERQSQTLLGIWSNIKDNLTRTLAALGEDLDRTFHVREGMKVFLAWLDRVRAWFEGGGIQRFLAEHKRQIELLAGAFTGMLIPAAVSATKALVTMAVSFARALGPWAIVGAAAVGVLRALGVSLSDLKRWAAMAAQAFVGLAKVGRAVVDNFAGIVAFWRSAIGGMLDAFKRALFFLDRAWKAIQEKNIEGARFALQTAASALSGGLKQAFDRAASESASFFDRANKLAEDGLTQIFMTVQSTLGETARATQEAFDEIAAEAEKFGQTIAALADGASAPIPQLNAGLEQTGEEAGLAKEKILSLNEAIKRQLDLLGQAAPRVAEYADAYLGVVSPREESGIVGAGTTPSTIVPSYGGRGARRGGMGEVWRKRAEERRRALREEMHAERAMLKAETEETANAVFGGWAEIVRRQYADLMQWLRDQNRAERAMWRAEKVERDATKIPHHISYGGRGARRGGRPGGKTSEGLPPPPEQDVTAMYQQYQQSRLAARAAQRDPLAGLLNRVGQAFGGLLAQLNPLTAVLQKLNPIMEILNAMLEGLAPVLEPLVEIFRSIGYILADLLAPALEAIVPIIQFVGRVFRVVAEIVAGIWNAFARVVNTLLGWLGVHIEEIKIGATEARKKREEEERRRKAAQIGPPEDAARRIRYELPQAPVLAAPRWVDEMGKHVATFGKAVNQFAQVVDRSSGALAWSVRGVA